MVYIGNYGNYYAYWTTCTDRTRSDWPPLPIFRIVHKKKLSRFVVCRYLERRLLVLESDGNYWYMENPIHTSLGGWNTYFESIEEIVAAEPKDYNKYTYKD